MSLQIDDNRRVRHGHGSKPRGYHLCGVGRWLADAVEKIGMKTPRHA